MDLAMAMGVAMFGLFGASTAIFLYKLTVSSAVAVLGPARRSGRNFFQIASVLLAE